VGFGRTTYCDDCAPYEWRDGRQRVKLKPCSLCGAPRMEADRLERGRLCLECRTLTGPAHRRKILTKYGLTPRQYQDLLDAQRGVCFICQRKSVGIMLAVDHSHQVPMIVRGLLCSGCNSMLGVMHENVEWFERAARYLRYPPALGVLGEHYVPGSPPVASPKPVWEQLSMKMEGPEH
jgi:recombination endonuclease VII